MSGLGAIRGVLGALLVSAAAWLVVRLGISIPPKVHGMLLGAAAIVFSISEVHFRNLLSELNTVFRRGSYSVWQTEKLQQIVPAVRSKVWRSWMIALCLKSVVIFAGALLQWDALPEGIRLLLLFLGYAFLFYSGLLSWSAWRQFRQLETQCDIIHAEEVSLRERKKLHTELDSGKPHDFTADQTLQGYTQSSPDSAARAEVKTPAEA